MVMATGSVCHQGPVADLPHQAGETSDEASAEAAALHERLVAYVHALAGAHEARSGVWVEHSYARARGATHAAAHVRVLLAPRAQPEPDVLDVEAAEPPPPHLPHPPRCRADSDPDSDRDEDDWEARVAALAPSAVHAHLAERALDALRRMRLERLVAPGDCARGEATRAAARRLRLALAAAAAPPAPPAPRPPAWLHAALLAHMPRTVRRLYDELTTELRRTAPRLAERMTGSRGPPPRPDPLSAVGPPVSADSSPWLVWLGCGRAQADARWQRRLGALVHTRVLPSESAACAVPETWCAAVAGSVRAALADALEEAGERPVILGGAGAGAALCAALVAGAGGGARVRGLLLLAPPLLTAEGARDTPDDPLAEVRLPMLVVVGTGAAQCWRGSAREVTRAAGRRVLELRGADDSLRLPAALRRRRRLPQHALDAAVAEECARWVMETAMSSRSGSPARERPRRPPRAPLAPAAPPASAPAAAPDEEEYAHLPAAASRPAPPACLAVPSTGADRTIEIIGEFSGRRGANAVSEVTNCVTLSEGRVVTRVSGGTPLALLPPRRRAGSPAPLAAADIMRLPIVFADDEPAPEAGGAVPSGAAPAGPLTVRAGGGGPAAGRYTRVIVASRGRGRGARPVLLRRGLRLLPR